MNAVILMRAEGERRICFSAVQVGRKSRSYALRFAKGIRMTALGLLVAAPLAAQRPDSPAAVKRYFDLVRPIFSGQRAFDQVAFMDNYFRWPGNEGFNASI